MAYENLDVHDALPRAWELFRADFSITLSATAYAQLKRHRMCTQLASAYDTGLGFTIPPSVREAGFEDTFTKAVKSAGAAADRLGSHYLLTNAHRRQVMVSMNGREFHHFCRLRDDAHAQWDIRGLAGQMLSLATGRAPQTLSMACGKSRWGEVSGKPVP
jgi:thymidylate synthase ThyX